VLIVPVSVLIVPSFTLIVPVLGDYLLHNVLLKFTDPWILGPLLAHVSRMSYLLKPSAKIVLA